jgi:hypothetical protein
MASTHGKVDDASIAKLAPGDFLRDTVVPGFHVRRNRDNTATYYLVQRARAGANPVPVKLGRWAKDGSGLSPKEARALASKRKAAKTLGDTPGYFRFPTLRDFVRDDLYPHFEQRRRVPPGQDGHMSKSTDKLYRGMIERHILDACVNGRALGDMRLDAITRAEIAAMHKAVVVKGRDASADMAVTVSTVVFGYAEVVYERQGYRRPVMRTFAYARRGYKRSQFADDAQREAFRIELNRRLSLPRRVGTVNQLLLIAALWVTAQRHGAVRRMRWDQRRASRNGEAFVMPPQDGVKMKRGETLIVVTAELQSILDRVVRYPGSPWVFSQPVSADGTYEVPPFPRHLFNEIAKVAGCEQIHPHDIRRSIGVAAADQDVPTDSLQNVFQHADAKTTKIYAPVTAQAVKDARRVASVIGSFVDPATPPRAPAGNVVHMKHRA